MTSGLFSKLLRLQQSLHPSGGLKNGALDRLQFRYAIRIGGNGSKPPCQKLHMKHGMIKMVEKIMRKKREIFGLDFRGRLDLLLQILREYDDSALQSCVYRHV